jgi:putative flippase GtrA
MKERKPNTSLQKANQFVKYQLGGSLYFAAAWSVITFGTGRFGPAQAYIAGNILGLSINYAVQRFWTFKAQKQGTGSGLKFIVFTVVSLALGYGLLRFLVVKAGLNVGVAQFVNAGFFTVWNWVWYKSWVFKEKS